jgi:hypothetical protein
MIAACSGFIYIFIIYFIVALCNCFIRTIYFHYLTNMLSPLLAHEHTVKIQLSYLNTFTMNLFYVHSIKVIFICYDSKALLDVTNYIHSESKLFHLQHFGKSIFWCTSKIWFLMHNMNAIFKVHTCTSNLEKLSDHFCELMTTDKDTRGSYLVCGHAHWSWKIVTYRPAFFPIQWCVLLDCVIQKKKSCSWALLPKAQRKETCVGYLPLQWVLQQRPH